MPSTIRQSYDHRIRDAIVESGDIALFPQLRIPDSTRRSWLRRGSRTVITASRARSEGGELQTRIAELERQTAILRAVLRLFVALVRTAGISLANIRVPSAVDKSRVMRAVDAAEPIIGRRSALRVLGLRQARFRSWAALATKCELEDAPPCPRSVPARLTFEERITIRDMVESEEYKHLSLRSLAILAQRLGLVYASYETWCRLTRLNRWRRPRRRLYPAKPKIGIRAKAAGELLHIDVTVIRLLDGTRTYLHAIVDNFSRRILAWSLQPKLRAETTRRLLREALRAVSASGPVVQVMTDGGSENVCVGELPELEHIIAQIDVTESNSIVEALWHQLRNRWVYLHTVDTFSTLERLIVKYFNDHNTLIPRAELGGRTPDEAFFGREEDLRVRLRERHRLARAMRVAKNQQRRCGACLGSETGAVA